MPLRSSVIGFASFCLFSTLGAIHLDGESETWNYCSVSTSGKPNANGVKMKGFFPCNWKEKPDATLQKEGIVCQYGLWEGGLFYSFSIGVTEISEELTKEEIKEIAESENIQDILPAGSTYISSKAITVDGVHGVRLVLKKASAAMTVYTTDAMLYKGRRAIIISFGVGGTNQSTVLNSFNSKKAEFEKMAGMAKFLE